MPTQKEIQQYPQDLVDEYISTLSELELIALKIAEEDLQTSFNIRKSIGFNNWLKTKKEI
tara:strand:+ start:3559 stop:3738 length:180 start_codon:yes stop_codon:yes gene_type:complete